MPLDADAEQLAHHLLAQEFVEIYAHHDADGIAAGAIIATAMHRSGRPFRLRCIPRITPPDLTGEAGVLLCDFGASREDLPPHVMVIDHHPPRFDGEFHVNPARGEPAGAGGVPAAGAAYFVAQHMGENRDLAGLALVGMVGDRQACTGANREILNDGIANGFITTGRGVLLPGRDLAEALALSIRPYLDGISGDEEAAGKLVKECSSDGEISLDGLLSLVVLRAGASAAPGALETLYGDTYRLEKEAIPDLHALTAVVDACGRAGMGGLAASLLLSRRAPGDEAWEALRSYRARVIAAIRSAQPLDVDGWYAVGDASVNGPVADALVLAREGERPVMVFSPGEGVWHISARCPAGVRMDLEKVIRELARSCDGDGGGHRCRAGATIGDRYLDRFRKGLAEATAA
ncbi:MAG: DHHA1 domain-containing protein [Methanomicrobiales archaeon]|nr:DHHA1 domain-containing protein [Methanomicrobiales archaeon]MDD1669631.1 DHHA1 domain-containing protein [Methanomicrobiales archaeon]